MAIEIVDFPIEHGGSFHSFLLTFTRGYCIYKYMYIYTYIYIYVVSTKISESYPVITCYNPLKMKAYQ